MMNIHTHTHTVSRTERWDVDVADDDKAKPNLGFAPFCVIPLAALNQSAGDVLDNGYIDGYRTGSKKTKRNG